MPLKQYLPGALLVLLAAIGFSLQPVFASAIYADAPMPWVSSGCAF